MFVDSHCHLDRLDPGTHGGDLAAALDAARARGVRQFLAIAVTLEEAPGVAAIARAHDDVAIAVGVHPLHRLAEEPGVEAIMEAVERERGEFFSAVRQAYLARAAAAPERIAVVDASRPLAVVGEQIEALLAQRVSAWR
jgi:Tat protein secretion system quality control protein TatD with DNase activity